MTATWADDDPRHDVWVADAGLADCDPYPDEPCGVGDYDGPDPIDLADECAMHCGDRWGCGDRHCPRRRR